jgi:hypothetical protein
MTLKEIVYNILGLYGGGKITDDIVPPERQIEFMVHYWRASMIRNDAERNSYVSSIFYQPLGVLDLELVDAAEDCDWELDCTILRTVQKVPKPIRLKDQDAIYIYTLDNKAIPLIAFDAVESIEGNRFVKGPYAIYRDERIYIVKAPKLFEVIRVRGIFENPVEVGNFNTCDDGACYTNDSQYPISADMVEKLTHAILSRELRQVLLTKADEINNSKNDIHPK